MSCKQSFQPLLSNVTINERMFRSKPYTKCIECLTNNRLRCQKCMELIIDSISKKSSPKVLKNMHDLSPSTYSQHNKPVHIRAMKTTGSIPRLHYKENQQKVMVTSKYNWWLNEKKRKREFEVNTLSSWPRKTRVNDYNLEKYGAKQPKFERWEKKLLDQLISKTNRIV